MLAAAISACDEPSQLKVGAMVDQAIGAVSRQNGGWGTARGTGAPVWPPAV